MRRTLTPATQTIAKGGTWDIKVNGEGIPITLLPENIKSRELKLVLPETTITQAQLDSLTGIYTYAKGKGVDFTITLAREGGGI